MSNPDMVGAIAAAVVERLKAEGLAVNFNPPAKPKLVDVKVAAMSMSRCVTTVRRMVASGEIPAHVVKRFGSRMLFIKEELDKWIAAH